MALEAVARDGHPDAAHRPRHRRARPDELLRRHFDRKHGPAAYYGQAAGATPGADNHGSGGNDGHGGEGDRVR